MTRPSSPHLSLRRALSLGALLAIVLLTGLLWRFRPHNFRARMMELHAVGQSPIAEHFARADHRDTPLARYLLANFADLDHYAQANRELPAATSDRVVLYGDSITEFWPIYGTKQFFPGRAYLDRGIRGQATPELLWRFRQDVLDLHPGTVVLLGGANDILLRNRYIGPQETERNLQAMVEAARQQHIRVILCLLTPIFMADPVRCNVSMREVRAINAWIRSYATANHLTTVDYFSALAASDGTMRRDLTLDGIHPNAAGYALMLPLAQKAIDATK